MPTDTNESVRFEERGANPRTLGWIFLGIFICGILIHKPVYLVYRIFAANTVPLVQLLNEQPLLGRGKIPLEVNSLPVVEAYRERQKQLLSGYEWVNPQKGIVRIPIERAMDLVIERGPATASTASTGPSPAPSPEGLK